MNQRWWIAIVGVVGIGLAFLLFPRPNTGEDIPDPNPQNIDPFKEGAKRKPGKAKPPIDPARISTDPMQKPGMKEIMEKRNRPEVVYATKLVTPFSAMRYTLAREGSEEAKALAAEIGETMAVMRTIRTDPDAMTWEEMQTKTDAMIAKVAATPFASNEAIVQAFEKYKTFIAEYEEAKSAPPAEDPAGTPDEAPSEQGEANP